MSPFSSVWASCLYRKPHWISAARLEQGLEGSSLLIPPSILFMAISFSSIGHRLARKASGPTTTATTAPMATATTVTPGPAHHHHHQSTTSPPISSSPPSLAFPLPSPPQHHSTTSPPLSPIRRSVTQSDDSTLAELKLHNGY